MIDVTALGAVGDGVTDDSAAIRAAIAAGSAIYFPAGTYLVSRDGANDWAIRVPAGKTLFTHSRNHSIIALADGQNCHTIWAAGDSIEFRNLGIDGNKQNQDGSETKNGLLVAGSNIAIKDCLFRNCDRNGVYLAAGTSLAQVTGNHAHDCDYAGIYCAVNGSLFNSKIIIANNICHDTGNAGIASAGSEIITLGNICFNNGNGEGAVLADGITTYYCPPSKQNVIAANIVSDGGQHGIHTGGDHCIVGLNAVRNVAARGIIHANTGDGSACMHVTIIGNDVDGTTGPNQPGIELRDCLSGSIAHNDVSGASGHGIVATTGPAGVNEAIGIEGNAAIGNALSGIRLVNMANGTLSHNRSRDNGNHGIYGTGGGATTIDGNNAAGNANTQLSHGGTGNVSTGNIA
jgi:parallel beta-helix repeat protein